MFAQSKFTFYTCIFVITSIANLQLQDVDNLLLLGLQLDIGSTQVANNSMLCIASPSIAWGQHNGSLISFSTANVGKIILCKAYLYSLRDFSAAPASSVRCLLLVTCASQSAAHAGNYVKPFR